MASNVPPPIKLKDFDVTAQLGAGAFATVYKGRRKTGAREVVAVKCVRKSGLSKTETDNLITEISLLKKLKVLKSFSVKVFQLYILIFYYSMKISSK